jgi:hypothetical protein
MEHRMWIEVPFDVGWDLEWPVLLLAAVCVGVLTWRRSIYVARAGVYFSSFFLFSTILYLLVEGDTKSRLMYNYPLVVLAAGGLMWL